MPKFLGTLNAPALASAPSVGVSGAMYYNTTDSTLYKSNGSAWSAVGGSSSGVTVSDTAPSSPTTGQQWFQASTTRMFIYYDSYWVEAAAPVSAVGLLDGGSASSTYGGISPIDAGGV